MSASTFEFLKKVLPAEPVYLLFYKAPESIHKSFDHLAEAAEAAVRLSDSGKDIYFACASYLKHPWKDEKSGKRIYRTKENWGRAKAFWVDVDCGEEKATKRKGYATQDEAVGAVLVFCEKYGLPKPMLVSSGYGLHVYWPLTEAIDPAGWVRAANILKSALDLGGVLADSSRTADFASVLRPVGTTNNKLGEGKPVEVILDAEPTATDDFIARLQNIVSNHDIEVPKEHIDPNLNDDLTCHLPPKTESFGEVVANNCRQVGLVRDTKGNVGYQQWFGVAGVLKFCVDGEKLFHEWSSGHKNYTEREAQQKYDSWITPPTTCKHFLDHNPAGCAGCKHKGKINTPIVLGYASSVGAEQQVEVVIDGQEVLSSVPALPNNYRWAGEYLVRQIPDKDGVIKEHAFSHTLFYPTHRIRRTDSSFGTRFRMHLPDKRVRDFDIDTQTVGAGGQDLVKALGRYEVLVTSNKGATEHLTAYVRESVKNLMQRAEEINTLDSFGWKNDMQAFLIGRRLYHKDGSVRDVILGGNAHQASRAFPAPRGTAAGWSKGIDFIYNRDGMEPMQYAICSAFGSVLGVLGESLYKGIPVALTGSGTGKGKTTACYAALYAFGDADQMTFKTEMGATPRARTAKMGTFQNLPLLFDEVTNIQPKELSELLYVSSNGGDRERLTAGRDGVRAADTATWNLSALITANKHLGSALAAGGNTQAEAVRLFEIKVDSCDIPLLDTAGVMESLKHIEHNMGSAGEKYIQYLVSHLDEVAELWREQTLGLAEDALETQRPQYRFFRQHMLCTLIAAQVMQQLELIDFNLEKLRTWAILHVNTLCKEVAENNTISGDVALHQLIGDLSPRILVTKECRDGRSAKGPELTNRITGPAAGRYVQGGYGSNDPMTGWLYLNKKDIREWCLKNRVEQDAITKAAANLGVLINEDELFQLGRGTDHVTGRTRCIVIDLHKLNEQTNTQFKLINGGRFEEEANVV